MGIVSFTVQSAGLPVQDALVSILSDAGVEVASSITGDDGKVLFDLVEGVDYFITANHNEYNITTYKISGLALGDYDLIAEAKAIRASNDPDICIVSGVFTDLSNVRLESWTFNISAAEGYYGTDNAMFYGDMPVTVSNGDVEISLVNDTSYIFSNLPFCPAKSVYIPKARSARLVDVLLPRVVEIPNLPLAVAMSTSSTTEIDLTPVLSNTLTGPDVPPGMLEVEVSEPSLITAILSSSYKLTLSSSKSAGEVTLNLMPAVDIEEGIFARLPLTAFASIKVSIE